MDPLELVRLHHLMARSQGRADVAVGLVDGPVAWDNVALSEAMMQELPGDLRGSCVRTESIACRHATFVAGMLVARRGSSAPAICPGCTLILRPIFPESRGRNAPMPGAIPEDLAKAIVDCIDAGARIINLSAALDQPSLKGEARITEALDYAARRGVLVVAAAGNQGTLRSSAITHHPWVIPVVACDFQGKPTAESNLGSSIGRRGLKAPGVNITSLGTDGNPQTLSGTSAAAPFVTGAIALLWSEFPRARAGEVKSAMLPYGGHLSNSLVPPLLDAWAAFELLTSAHNGRNGS